MTRLLTLVYPFNERVWELMLVTTCFAFIAIYLINLKAPITIFDSFQLLISSIISDSVSPKMKAMHNNWYGGIVLTIWFMCGFLLLSAYSSNLLASLMVVKMTKADNTFAVKLATHFHLL